MLPLIFFTLVAAATAFVHPGALHTAKDFERVSTHLASKDQPWSKAWNLLTSSSYAQSSYQPKPQVVVYRGDNGDHAQNYQYLYRDAAAAYQLAVRWKVSNDSSYADAAVNVLSSWAVTLTSLEGSSDKFLAAGIYGYQLANAAELMADYTGWNNKNKTATANMLTNIFANMNNKFLGNHNGQSHYHYYANWDLCNLASLIATAIFTENQTMYDNAVKYVHSGPSNGAFPVFGIANFTEQTNGKVLTQGQEAGRDQGHATLDFVLLGVIAQQAYNQGDDLFSDYKNEILNG